MNTDYFDYKPQRFYLLSVKSRRLFSFQSADRSLEAAVEEAFERLPRLEGGNVYAVFRYEPVMLKVLFINCKNIWTFRNNCLSLQQSNVRR